MSAAAPHVKASFRGGVTCVRAASMLVAARDLLIAWGQLEVADGLWITQGSYQPETSFSSRTHCGCGVVDVGHGHRVTGREWTTAEWWWIVRALRAVGFAAWHRPAIPDLWPDHTHAVAGNCPELDPEADIQWAAYLIGLNGLNGSSRGPDAGPREFVGVTWESYQVAATLPGHAASQEGDDMQSFMKVKNRPEVYVSDGRTAFHIPDLSALADYITLIEEGTYTIRQAPANAEGSRFITCGTRLDGSALGVWVREVGRVELVGKVL